MADFGFGTAQTLDASQWIAESQKARKATEENTKAIDRLAKRTAGAEKKLGSAGRRAGRTADQFGGLKKAAAGVFAGFSAAIVVRQLGRVLEATGQTVATLTMLADAQRAAERQVAATIERTGQAAGLTAAEVGAMASELQRATGIGDEVILTYANMGLTFKGISSEIFPEMIEVALDMAEVLKRDVQSQLLAVAKALEDPERRMSELSRAGTVFTQVQIDQVKALVASGQKLEAQKVLMAELQSQYGGAARAARQDLGGALKALQADAGDLGEVVGHDLGEPMSDLVETLIALTREARPTAEELGANLAREMQVAADMAKLLEQNLSLVLRVLGKIQVLPGGETSILGLLASNTQLGRNIALLAQLNAALEEGEENERAFAEAVEHWNEEGTIQVEQVERYKGILPGTSAEVKTLAERIAELEDPLETEARLSREAEEAARAHADAERKRNEVWEEARQRSLDAISALREYKELLGQVSGANAPDLLPESMLEFPKIDGAEIGGEIGIAIEDVVIPAGEEVAGRWGSAIAAAGSAVAGQWQDAVAGALAEILSGGSIFEAIGGAAGGLAATGIAAGLESIGLPAPIAGVLGDFGGQLVDKFISEFESTAQGFANAITVADGLARDVTEGDLSGAVGDVMSTIQDDFNAILDLVGGTVTQSAEVAVLYREDSKQWRAKIGGVWHQFGEDVRGMISFVTAELVKLSGIRTDRPELQQALQGFAGETAEELQQALALAFRLEAGRIGPEAAGVQDSIRQWMDDILAGIAAGIDSSGGIAGLSQVRDELLGITRSAEETTALRIDAFNAEIQAQMLSIEAQMLGVQADLEATTARGHGIDGFIAMSAAAIDAEGLRVEAMAGATEATLQMAGASSDIVARMAGVLAALGDLLIDADDERAAAIRRAAGRARGGRAGGGRSRTREALQTLGLLDDATDGFIEALGRVGRAIEREWTTMEEVLAAIEREVLGAVGGALGFLESMLPGIEDAELRARIEEQIGDLARRQAELELVMHQARLTRLLVELEALGMLDDATRAWLEGALGALGDVAANFDDIFAGLDAAAEDIADLFGGKDGLGDLDNPLAGPETSAKEIAEAMERAANEARGMFESLLSSASGIISTALPYITDPEERARLEALLVQLAQEEYRLQLLSFQLSIEEIRSRLLAAGQLDDATAAWLDSLGDVAGILGENLDDIFAGLAEQIEGAGEGFAGSVAGVGSAIQAMILPLLHPELLPTISPGGMTLEQIEALYGGQLGGLMGQLMNLEAQSLGQATDPLQALLDQFIDLEPFFEAFGISLADITERIDALREAEEARAMEASLGSLADAFQTFIDGPMSGLSDRARFELQEEDIMARLAAAQAGELSAAELQALAGDLPGFFQLAQSGLGAGFGQFGENMLAMAAGIPGLAELLGLAPGGGAPPIDTSGVDIRPGDDVFFPGAEPGFGGASMSIDRLDQGIVQRDTVIEEIRLLRAEVRGRRADASTYQDARLIVAEDANDIAEDRLTEERKRPKPRTGALVSVPRRGAIR